MSNLIDATGQSRQSGSQPQIRSNQPLQSGTFRGERITRAENPEAKLADAAEELSFSQSERAESKLSKRRIKSGRGIRPQGIELAEEVAQELVEGKLAKQHKKSGLGSKSSARELAEKYQQRVPDVDKDKIDKFASRALAQAGSGATPKSLRRDAREAFPDQTHQFIALSYARDQAQAQGQDPKLVAVFQTACEQLMAEAGPAIQAGLNVSAVAQRYADKGLDDTHELRGLYRDVVLDYDTVVEAYDRVTARYPDKQFPEAVSFLLQSLSVDLGAGSQSLSRVRLKQVIDDMGQLKTLSSLYDQCKDLLTRIRNNYATVRDDVSTRDLMKELLVAQDKGWQGGNIFTDLPDKLGIRTDEPAIYFMRGFKEVLRLMPLKVFNDDTTKRDRTLQSVQQSMDALIENEELANE